MILNGKQLDINNKQIGNKAKGLIQLINYGFSVPDFYVVPSGALKEIVEKKSYSEAAEQIGRKLKVQQYAIRVAVLNEDKKDSSKVGQSKTLLGVTRAELEKGIKEVVDHAVKDRKIKPEEFSLVIQEFIEADRSGVVFTRNPIGGREMVVEHIRGRGDKLLSGEKKGQRLTFYWTNVPRFRRIPNFKRIVSNFKAIEKAFSQPMDIEWCYRGWKFYFLQARPIATIKAEKYKEIKYLDSILPKRQKYFYEKTSLSEIIPRPTPLIFDILEKIYSRGGPVSRVYGKYGIDYTPIKFFLVLGNELYVDREREVKTLFPERNIINPSIKDRIPANFDSLVITLKNEFCFSKIKIDEYEKLFIGVIENIDFEFKKTPSVRDLIEKLIDDYEIVFRINLLTGTALSRLESALHREAVTAVNLLASAKSLGIEASPVKPKLNTDNFLGNTLDLFGKEKFKEIEFIKHQVDRNTKAWWDGLGESKQNSMKNRLEICVGLIQLREYCRWLVVKNVNALRQELKRIAREASWEKTDNIYFARLSEVLTGHLYEKVCEERKEEYEKLNRFSLPKIVSSEFVEPGEMTTVGISPGEAEGVLADESELRSKKSTGEKIILFTKILNPGLVDVFDRVEGIVSGSGSLLSHLAILAREQDKPVVVNVNLKNERLKFGDRIRIDGSSGKITKF